MHNILSNCRAVVEEKRAHDIEPHKRELEELSYWEGVSKDINKELQPLYFYNSPFRFWQLVKGQRISSGFGISDLNYQSVLSVLDLYGVEDNIKLSIFEMIIRIDNIYMDCAERNKPKQSAPAIPNNSTKH